MTILSSLYSVLRFTTSNIVLNVALAVVAVCIYFSKSSVGLVVCEHLSTFVHLNVSSSL